MYYCDTGHRAFHFCNLQYGFWNRMRTKNGKKKKRRKKNATPHTHSWNQKFSVWICVQRKRRMKAEELKGKKKLSSAFLNWSAKRIRRGFMPLNLARKKTKTHFNGVDFPFGFCALESHTPPKYNSGGCFYCLHGDTINIGSPSTHTHTHISRDLFLFTLFLFLSFLFTHWCMYNVHIHAWYNHFTCDTKNSRATTRLQHWIE